MPCAGPGIFISLKKKSVSGLLISAISPTFDPLFSDTLLLHNVDNKILCYFTGTNGARFKIFTHRGWP